MSSKIPHLTDKKRKKISEEELELFYKELDAYYAALPFDEAENTRNENYYRVTSSLFRTFSFFRGTKVLNREQIPSGRGVIYVSNHIGSYDQFFITSALGTRPIHYLVKEKVTTWPVRWNLIYKPTGVVVLNQESLSSWKDAKTKLVQYLRNGKDIFIFPEGTRRGEDNLGEFSAGVAQVVQESKSPVVTLAIKNSAKILSRKRAIVCVGEILSFDLRDDVRLITQEIQDSVYDTYEQIEAYEKTLKRR